MTREERDDLIGIITTQLYKVDSFEDALSSVISDVINCAPLSSLESMEKRLRKEVFDSINMADHVEEACSKQVLIEWVNNKLNAAT